MLMRNASGNSNIQPALRTTEMGILKFTLLEQSRVYALLLASQQKKSD
jgi:hypothetical protein